MEIDNDRYLDDTFNSIHLNKNNKKYHFNHILLINVLNLKKYRNLVIVNKMREIYDIKL